MNPQIPTGDSHLDVTLAQPKLRYIPLSQAAYAEAYEPEPAADPASGGLLEYWRILQRYKGAVILITCLGLLSGILFTLPQTPIYQARTLIEIQGVNEDFLQMKNVNPNSSNSYYPEIDIQTQVRVLQSRFLLNRVSRKLELQAKPMVENETRFQAWRKALGIAPAKSASTRESAIATAAGGLKVRGQPNTRLIEILCDSPQPELAADFANTLTSEFVEQNLEARWQGAQHTGDWLTRQLADTKIRLEKSEEELQEYARHTNLLFTQEKDNVSEQKLKQIQDELGRAQAERVSKQSRYELATRTSAESLGEVIEDASLKDLQSKLTDLRRQTAELSATYTPSHPKVKRLQEQIQVLESARERERANIVHRIQNDFDAAQRREKLLSVDYANHVKLMAGQMDSVGHYNILKREVDTNRQMYDGMLQRVKEAGIASALRATNIRVVDPATTPGAPYKPNLSTNASLGLVSGLFFGIVFVVFRDRANHTIREPGDAHMYTGLRELGLIPSASADPFRKRGFLAARPLPGEEAERLELVTLQRQPSAMAEAVRNTLMSLLYARKNGRRPQVLVFSSAAPKEGKTTICTNLAVSLAQIHQRVLLIDADVRKPRMHSIFNLENGKGLVDLLRRPDPITAPLNGHVRETQQPNLSVMTSGDSHAGDASLLHSKRLHELIARVRQDFDMILIDTPPMLTMPDARIIAREADAVVVVARANLTSRDSLRDVYKSFSEDGTHVLGAVLNGWDPKKSRRYGYGKYYDRYKNYYGGSKKIK